MQLHAKYGACMHAKNGIFFIYCNFLTFCNCTFIYLFDNCTETFTIFSIPLYHCYFTFIDIFALYSVSYFTKVLKKPIFQTVLILVFEMESVWRHPFSCIVGGPSGAGKTWLVKRILERRKEMIFPVPERVIWCYTEEQPTYNSLKDDPEISFVQGFPDPSTLANSLCIFDDMLLEMKDNPFMQTLTTRGCHHWKTSCITLSQNVFLGNRTSRINSTYMILMKNPSDRLQVSNIARQLFPDNTKYFLESYSDATKEPHSYLFIDLHQKTPDHARLRAHILPDETTIVYTPINKHAWKCVAQY